MTEWGVVGVIITLFGLIATFVKVGADLTKTITKLSVVVDRLDKTMETNKKDVHESFQKVWTHEEEQDDKINEHEIRLQLLEQGAEE